MHDLVIRGGTIVNGTGGKAFDGDIAVVGGRIVAVGRVLEPGREEIDAKGRIVAPGWVDIHAHYDGQATWDPYLSPSGAHGVTSVVMGNCGVGFAPVRPEHHDWIINVMEGVEDIPGTALVEGIKWDWETFPQYLDALDRKRWVMDVATQVPHSAVRAYVMGERGATNEPATEDDIRRMAAIVEEGARAGALGFSTSRTRIHAAADGSAVAGSFADDAELMGLGRALARAGHGVFQMVSDFNVPETEFGWMERLSRETGLPVHYLLLQYPQTPTKWRDYLALTERATAAGADIRALVGCRPIGMLVGIDSKFHPFSAHPSFLEVAGLPLPERVRRMRDPAFRRKLLSETTTNTHRWWRPRMEQFQNMYALGDPPQYEPPPESSVAAIARREGRTAQEVVYDLMLDRDGEALILCPFVNYADNDLSPQYEQLQHPQALISLADGGAHCGFICDVSAPTYLMAHWVRDRTRGPRLPLEQVVRIQSWNTAASYGLNDRGRLLPGLRADINVIDLDRLQLRPPRWVHDLPANGKRIVQDAVGYDATITAGEITYRDGVPTGAMPGRLIRGPKAAA